MTGSLPLRLYMPYYHNAHPARRAELDECLRRNIANEAFERLVLFVDRLDEYADLRSARVDLVQTQGRMPKYNEFLDHASGSPDRFILVISNTDIHFDETIAHGASWRHRPTRSGACPAGKERANRIRCTQRGPGAATELDQPHRDREGMCAITMPCVCSPTVATLTPCHKIGCKIVHSVQDFHN